MARGAGARVADLEISRAWLVDPASGREGPGEIVVEDGILVAVTWLSGPEAEGVDDRGVVVAPGFTDLHAHLREPGNEDAETVATGLAAAAHGGFTTVCAMADTSPVLDEPSILERLRGAAAASGSPVVLRAHGAVSVSLAGEQLAALGELADAAVVGFSDDDVPVRSAAVFRNALAYAGMVGLPLVDHAEDPVLAAGAEAGEGHIATVLGLRGAPTAAEAGTVARDLAILADVVRDVPEARLHLAHLSTAASLELVRAAKARGLAVTCDVTPHHVALSDEWLAGARRWAWEALGPDADPRDPWRDSAIAAVPFDTALRTRPPLRPAADAAACLAALADGTADAVATDHGPRSEVEILVEFGDAPGGISGLETALGILLAAVDAGRLSLAAAIAALTTGPARVLGDHRAGSNGPGLVEGQPADLVVFDRASSWIVTAEALLSRGKNSPLIGRALPGVVLLTVAGGRIAWESPAD